MRLRPIALEAPRLDGQPFEQVHPLEAHGPEQLLRELLVGTPLEQDAEVHGGPPELAPEVLQEYPRSGVEAPDVDGKLDERASLQGIPSALLLYEDWLSVELAHERQGRRRNVQGLKVAENSHHLQTSTDMGAFAKWMSNLAEILG